MAIFVNPCVAETTHHRAMLARDACDLGGSKTLFPAVRATLAKEHRRACASLDEPVPSLLLLQTLETRKLDGAAKTRRIRIAPKKVQNPRELTHRIDQQILVSHEKQPVTRIEPAADILAPGQQALGQLRPPRLSSKRERVSGITHGCKDLIDVDTLVTGIAVRHVERIAHEADNAFGDLTREDEPSIGISNASVVHLHETRATRRLEKRRAERRAQALELDEPEIDRPQTAPEIKRDA